MNPSNFTSGQFIFFLLLGMAMFVAYPFVKASLVHVSTRILKFRIRSYWKAFFCVLIGLGATMALQTIIFGMTIRPGQGFDVEKIVNTSHVVSLLGMLLTPIVEGVSLYFFFNESVGKTIGAVALTYAFLIGLFVALLILFFLLMIVIGLVSG